MLREVLGEHVHEFLIRNKREEWDAYKAYVTPYELERYLPSSDAIRRPLDGGVGTPGDTG